MTGETRQPAAPRGTRGLATAAIGCIAAGCLCAVIAAIPFASLRPLGELIRRVDDVTPERHARLVQACLAWAVGLITSGGLLWRNRGSVATWLSQLASDFRTALAQAPAAFRNWGWMMGLIAVAGIGLRTWHLNDSMAYDESYTFVNLARQPIYIGIADYNSTNNHLLNTLLMHLSWRLFGDAEWALRLPVFLTGCALIPLIWIWSSRWLGRPAGLVTTALAAMSPLLITYSTDARGYILVTFAAVALDDAAARLFERDASRPLATLQIVLAAALGLCSMPIMLYAIVWTASILVFRVALLEPQANSGTGVDRPKLREFAGQLIGGGLVFCLIVGLMYTPAFIFRGTRAMRDPILETITLAQQARAQGDSLVGGWDWCTTGWPGGWFWGLGLLAAAVGFRTTAVDRLRWLLPFVVYLALNLLGQVAPPPRVMIILAPWLMAGVAAGWAAIALRASRDSFAPLSQRIAAGLVVLGLWYAATHPVLIYPAERTSFVSVREALEGLKARIAREPDGRHRLIAPLPCDLPAIFYREREGIPVEVNGQPQPDEVLWLLARHGETPAGVLATPLIGLTGLEQSRPPFEEIGRFQTLILFRSKAKAEPQDQHTEKADADAPRRVGSVRRDG